MTWLKVLKNTLLGLSCFTLVAMVMSACLTEQSADPEYLQSVEDWHQNRLDRLTRPIGWTTLAGLRWLPDGTSTFGSSDSCDIRLESSAPEFLGIWTVSGDTINLSPNQDITVFKNDTTFTGGAVVSDKDARSDMLNWEALYWTVIHRGGRYAVRIWDTLSPDRYLVDSIPRYPVDEDYAVAVQVRPPYASDSVIVDNALGFTQSLPVAGYVEGRINDTAFSLIALDGGPEKLFMIFADLTTDIETYSGGRYSYIARPDADGTTILDFNIAYNPPCVFTEHATCLLPPESNFIATYIRAGEKDFSLHH